MIFGDIEPHLGLWPDLEGAKAVLVNLSENHTFRLDCPDGRAFGLRVHRPGYLDRRAIVSELSWVQALGGQTSVLTPRPVPGVDDNLVQNLSGRQAVLFHWVPGQEPAQDADLTKVFQQLGRLAAQCHMHAMSWKLPAGFIRPTWDVAAMVGPEALWGDWRIDPLLDDAGIALLQDVVSELTARFGDYGRAKERFGLFHADMRLANLLVHKNTLRVIDFDDCGFGWFICDFGAAVSFFENAPVVPALWDAWVEGYSNIRTLSAADLAMRDSAVIMRRLQLLAWISSHSETELARSHAPSFAKGTMEMAKNYLEQKSIYAD